MEYKIRLGRRQRQASNKSASTERGSSCGSELFDISKEDCVQGPLQVIKSSLANSTEDLLRMAEIYLLEARQAELEILLRDGQEFASLPALSQKRLFNASRALEFLQFAPDRFDLIAECHLHQCASHLIESNYQQGCKHFILACNLVLVSKQLSKENSDRLHQCITRISAYDGPEPNEDLEAASIRLFRETCGIGSG